MYGLFPHYLVFLEFSLTMIIIYETLEISFYCSGGLLKMQMLLNVRGNWKLCTLKDKLLWIKNESMLNVKQQALNKRI